MTCDEWFVWTVEASRLQSELNNAAKLGYEIFQVMPVNNTHVTAVTVKRAPELEERAEEVVKAYHETQKKLKGKKS